MVENETLKKFRDITVYATLIINVSTITLSLLAYTGILVISMFAGFFFIVALLLNLSTIFFTFANLNREDVKGRKLKNLCYIFMVFFFFAMFFILFKQLIFAVVTNIASYLYPIAEIIYLLGYFGILGLGLLLVLLNLRYIHRHETWLK